MKLNDPSECLYWSAGDTFRGIPCEVGLFVEIDRKYLGQCGGSAEFMPVGVYFNASGGVDVFPEDEARLQARHEKVTYKRRKP